MSIKQIVADLARPFSIYTTSGAASWAIVDLSSRINDGNAAAIFITAVLAGTGAQYGLKAWENAKAGEHTAQVEKARAQSTPPPGTAQITAAPDVDVKLREASDGELPPDQRVRL